MALAKGQGGGQPSPAAQNLRQRVGFTLFPQAERGTLVLLAGGLLIAVNTYSDPSRRDPLVAMKDAIVSGKSAPDKLTAVPGAALRALKADMLSAILVVVLAFFAATSDELGTLAVLVLAALWVGWALNTFGKRASSAPKSQ